MLNGVHAAHVEVMCYMARVNIKSGHFLAERQKIRQLKSRLIESSIDFIDSSLWLIAGGRLAQALVMLDNAIEVALKGELERIHRILIASSKELNDFRALKSLLKDAFLAHPSGGGLNIPDFDIERTIYFDEAFDRVAELYPELRKTWRQRLASGSDSALHSLRNSIVHYGGDPTHEGEYVQAIVDVALPFMEDFLGHITQGTVSLRLLMMEWLHRELGVAQAVLRDLRAQGEKPKRYAINTLQHHALWTYAGWPSPTDDLDTIRTFGETDWEQYAERSKRALLKTWDEAYTIDIECPVCDSQTPDGSYVSAHVLLDDQLVEQKSLVPVAFACFVCGLSISPDERLLAKHFVGALPDEKAQQYLKDIGVL